ncbi:MAG TPA: cell division protein FtsA, partial [Rhodospirillales bacterium]|nr:cell division protein FtsA [Rhodospirillales bacterium]
MEMKRSKKKIKVRNGLIAALDVGTTKVCCFIARPEGPKGELRVVGVGHHISEGLRCGEVVNMDAAERSIRASVEDAEKMAGENIRQVIVNLSCGGPKSKLIAYGFSIAGHEIGDSDLRRVLDTSGLIKHLPNDHELVHSIPVGYRIDGARGVRDPRGMFGEHLGVNLHVISASVAAVRNLASSVAHCHLDIEGKVVSSYASALSCLVEDEKQLGAALIDMGGGATSTAVYFDSELVHTDVIQVGGVHVTNDIARGLSTPLVHAERMKILYGNAIPSPSDDREVIKVPLIGEEGGAEASQVPRSMLVGIIRPRLEEIFEMARGRLEDAGFAKLVGRVVLTGGASQLPGIRDLAATIFDKQTRIGRPTPTTGLAESMSGPAFATCAGILKYAAGGLAENSSRAYRPVR